MSRPLRRRVAELEAEVENLWSENQRLEEISDRRLIRIAELERGRPGIGAVVAMVAVGRVVAGQWKPILLRLPGPVMHWDFAPAWMAPREVPACGSCWPSDYGAAYGLDDVDCPDCLAIARRAGVLKEVE